jgi:hypothetical protein
MHCRKAKSRARGQRKMSATKRNHRAQKKKYLSRSVFPILPVLFCLSCSVFFLSWLMYTTYLYICICKGRCVTMKMLRRKNKTQFENRECNMQKRNCSFKLFKVHCATTVNAKNAGFHKQHFFSTKNTSVTF